MTKQKWKVPIMNDGNLFGRINQTEKHFKSALDLLHEVKQEIPHTPASETKSKIEIFLSRFI